VSRRCADGGSNRSELPPESECLTVAQLLAAFWEWATLCYRSADGRPASELHNLRLAFRPLRQLFGRASASHFGPRGLPAVRQTMIDRGLARTGINKHVSRIKGLFKWAVAHELVAADVLHSLQAVTGHRLVAKQPAAGHDPGQPRPIPRQRGDNAPDQFVHGPVATAGFVRGLDPSPGRHGSPVAPVLDVGGPRQPIPPTDHQHGIGLKGVEGIAQYAAEIWNVHPCPVP